MKGVKTIIAVLLMHTLLTGQAIQAEYQPLTTDQIDELRGMRHAFYEAESRGMNEAIRAELLLDRSKVDGNQNDYDVRYYGIDLRLDFTSETISGQVDYQIQSLITALSQVDLNLVDQLVVAEVTVAGEAATFVHTDGLLSVILPGSYATGEEFEMTVYYGGDPVYSGASGMEFGLVDGYQMCWTHCSPYASRHWWPSKDYPVDKADSVDLYFEYPTGYVCVSNGVEQSDVDLGDGYHRIHYSHNYPITTYLVAVVCAEFDEHVQSWDYNTTSMPVHSYALPSAPDEFEAFKTVVPDVLTRLSDRWGLYPFAAEKMASASYGWGGAMEHQTCAFYNPTFYYDWVIAHETGHQWWGDKLSACNFHHVWLKEGFASYSESIYFEHRDGQQAYFDHMQTQTFYGGGTVYVEDLLNDDIFDPNLTYDKASWVVHMLRGVIGDADFFLSTEMFQDTYAYSCAVTEDLSDVVSTVTGEDMSWYFNQWIYGAGNPDYEYSWLCEPGLAREGYDLHLFVDQVQTYGTYFRMPIRMTFETTAGDVDSTIWNQAPQTYYSLHFTDSVTAIQLDPDEWILRETTELPFTLRMIPRDLPDGHLDFEYRVELRGIGGVAPYSWVKTGGDLPFGLTLDADSALIKGTPSWPANYYFTLQVEDSDSPPASEVHNFTIVIHEDPPVICGDADRNAIIYVSDAVYLISYIFAGGPAPDPYETGDADCNDLVNVTDAVYLIQYIFAGGPEPCADCP
jgi:hypothetical protein